MSNLKIHLTARRTDFSEIYYRDKQGSWLLNPTTKTAMIQVLLMSVGLVIFCYSYKPQPDKWLLLLIVWGILAWGFVSNFRRYYQWRKSIEVYLDKILSYKHCLIEITDNYFSLTINDFEETIEHFSEFKTMTLNDEYVSFVTNRNNYLIPKKSMTPEEFVALKVTLSESVKR